MSEGPQVLVVEDEAQVRRFLRASLRAHGFRVLEASTGSDALRMAEQYVPDVVLLDLGLPDIDGIDVTRQLRSWSEIPVVVLSARGQESQKVEALDSGADDYVTKPFGVEELLARLRVALRRAAKAGPAEVFTAGGLEVDLSRRRVTVDGAEVHLTPIEYKILTTLIRSAGGVVTHKQLLESVWGPHAGERTHYLRVYMTHLRRKLEPDPVRPRFILTEAGVGYRLRTDN